MWRKKAMAKFMYFAQVSRSELHFVNFEKCWRKDEHLWENKNFFERYASAVHALVYSFCLYVNLQENKRI